MVVSVAFYDSPKTYDYLTDLVGVKRGDLVVVPTGSPPHQRFAVVTVVGIKEDSAKAQKWVVQRVDVKGWQRRMNALLQDELEAMFA